MELLNKTVLVTGAGRGIGAAAAAAVARQGARVAVTARRQEDAVAVASQITAAGGQALALSCNVAEQAEVEQTVQLVTDEWGGIDILVSNAGTVQPISRIAEANPQAWLQAVEINLAGAYFCLRAVLPQMVERRSGVVIHLSSGAAHRPLEGWSAYCASKAGLAMLTRSLHEEYANQGICAIGFSPGVVDTGMQAEIRASGINPVSRIPRENLASVDEPARAIAFLCGPDGAVYAGQEVDVRDPAFREACNLPAL